MEKNHMKTNVIVEIQTRFERRILEFLSNTSDENVVKFCQSKKNAKLMNASENLNDAVNYEALNRM